MERELKLLLQPLVSLLERLHVPKPAGALVALAVLLSVFIGLGMLLSSPAARWVSELPQTWPQDARTVFQGTLCGIAVLACLYVAQDIVLPVVLALVHVITLSRLW